jgi:hypothetical protein
VLLAFLEQPLQARQALFKVDGGVDVVETHAESHHREGNRRLDADDHRFRAPEPGRMGQVEQRAGAEGVHDVERGDIDDDAARAMGTDLLDEILLELDDLAVVQRLVDRGDEIATLPQDRTSISTVQSVEMVVDRFGLGDLEPEQALRLFDAALEVADSVHLAKVDPDGHQRLGDLR